jgi:hypothetical protein
MCCCLAINYEHIAIDPIMLSNCNGNSCRKCFNEFLNKKTMCSSCAQNHEISAKNPNLPNPINITKSKAQKKSKLNELIGFNNEKFNELKDLLEGTKIDEEIDVIFQSTRNEIFVRTESLIKYLKDYQVEFETELKSFENQVKANVIETDLKSWRHEIQELWYVLIINRD